MQQNQNETIAKLKVVNAYLELIYSTSNQVILNPNCNIHPDCLAVDGIHLNRKGLCVLATNMRITLGKI